MRYTEGYVACLRECAAGEKSLTGLTGMTVLITGMSGLVSSELAALVFEVQCGLVEAARETLGCLVYGETC